MLWGWEMAERAYIVAEIGVNHNGDVDLARRMIDAAAASDADAAKFQTFNTNALVSREAEAAPYAQHEGRRSQFDLLRGLELSRADFETLCHHCREVGLDFVSTPFDASSAQFLAEALDVPWLKVPSGEIVNGPLLHAIARLGRPLVASTGMATEAEIRRALSVISHGLAGGDAAPDPDAALSQDDLDRLCEGVTLLLCTSAYPTPPNEVNLRALDGLARLTGGRVGLSDHTAGILAGPAAVARGAVFVEKHFTIDRNLPGPDQAASLEPADFKRMIADIREVETLLGKADKDVQPAERDNIVPVRQSLVARCSIATGESFTPDNLTTRRPGGGLSPMAYWSLLGKTAARAYSPGEVIDG